MNFVWASYFAGVFFLVLLSFTVHKKIAQERSKTNGKPRLLQGYDFDPETQVMALIAVDYSDHRKPESAHEIVPALIDADCRIVLCRPRRVRHQVLGAYRISDFF